MSQNSPICDTGSWFECEAASSNFNTSSSPGQTSIKLHKDTIGPNVGRYPDPFQVPGHAEPFKLFENVRQRSILTAVVRFLKTLVEWEATDQSTPHPVFRALCCGVAGTGKTFIMQFIRIFTNIVHDHNDATKVLGPTGLSIGNCNGSTVDRALKAWDSCMLCIAHPTPWSYYGYMCRSIEGQSRITSSVVVSIGRN